MDPALIVESTAGLFGTCEKISGIISWINEKSLDDADPSLGVLRSELDSLSQVFVSIHTSFRETSVARCVLLPQTGYEGQHWRNVKRSLDDCKGSLFKLDRFFHPIAKAKRSQAVLQSKAIKAMIRELNLADVQGFKQQITSYRKVLELSQQLIDVSCMLSNDSSTFAANLFPRLEHLTVDMHQLHWLLREQKPSDSYIISNLQECIRSTGKILSSAKAIVEYRSLSGSEPSEPDVAIQKEQSKKVANWLPQVPSEFEGSTVSPLSPVSPAWEDKSLPRVGSKSTLRSVKSKFSITPPKYIGSSASTVVTEPFSSTTSRSSATTHSSIPPLEVKVDYDEVAEMDLIQQSLKLGSDSFAAKEYTKAELILRKLLKQSETKFGRNFSWRGELTVMLVEIYYKLGKRDDANTLLDQQCKSREKTFETLSAKFMQDRKWDYVVLLLRHEFQSRENVLERISRAFVLDKRWDDARDMLLDLIKYRSEESMRGLERMAILAEVCFIRKDYEESKHWCLRALNGKKTVLEKSHPLFTQFCTILVKVADLQGDIMGQAEYKALLSGDVNECAQLEKLFMMRSKDAASQVEKVFKDINLGTNKQRSSIRDNIKKSGKGVVGSGYGWTLMHAFAFNGRELAVKFLVDKGADVEAVDDDGNTMLICAANNGHLSIVQLLLKSGANHSWKNKIGNTALMCATLGAKEDVIKALLESGADIETKDKDDNTILMSAVMDKLPNIVNIALDAGANIEARNKAGRTALMLAVLVGDDEMSKLLIEKNANIEAKDEEGNTSLMVAATKEHVNLVELLLLKGADMNARNKRGNTALVLAKRSAVYRTAVVHRLINTKERDELELKRTVTAPNSRVASPTSVKSISHALDFSIFEEMEFQSAKQPIRSRTE